MKKFTPTILKTRGDHCVECPHCGRVFGNGVSVVHSNIVRDCICHGAITEKLIIKLQKKYEISEILEILGDSDSGSAGI